MFTPNNPPREWTKAEKAKYNRYLKKFREKGFIDIVDNRVANDFATYASQKEGRYVSVRGMGGTFRVI